MRIRVLLITLPLLCATWAVAQDDGKESDAEQKTTESKKAADSKNPVYTKSHLRDQVEGAAKSPAVIYNENLSGKTAGKGATATTVFTNDSLVQRYGPPDRTPAPAPPDLTEAQPAPGTAPDGNAGADSEAQPAADPAMSPEQRTERIAEIEGQIKRLEKRTLAIKNPYLAGTTPATDEERTEEKGMANNDRLKKVESEIEKLRTELDQLRSGS